MSWSSTSHENAVERFYSRGANGNTEIHGGFLNFGLWEDGVETYLDAARNMVDRIAAMLGVDKESRVLDVACGMGSQDLHLLRRLPGIEIDAMDVTWKHVERARRRAEKAIAEEAILGEGLRFHHGSATDLPFEKQTFTHVMSIEGPEHFRTRRTFFAEARRVLQPGGVMALADYSITREPQSRFEWHLVDFARALWKIPRENLWTPERYREELVLAGFTEACVEPVGELTFPGYYQEQCRPAFRSEMRQIQGPLVEWLGHQIDTVTNLAFERGLVDYVLVRAVEPRDG